MSRALPSACSACACIPTLPLLPLLLQLGLGGDASLPLSALVAKEITLRGTFRFQEEFALALDVLARRAIDPLPLLSATLPLAEAVAAFELAGDRRQAMKVQIAF